MRHLQRAQELLGFGSNEAGFGTPRGRLQKSEDTAIIINKLRQSSEMGQMVQERREMHRRDGHTGEFDFEKVMDLCTDMQSELQKDDASLLKKITGLERHYVSEYEVLEVYLGIIDFIWNEYFDLDRPVYYDPEQNKKGVFFEYDEPIDLVQWDDEQMRMMNFWKKYKKAIAW